MSRTWVVAIATVLTGTADSQPPGPHQSDAQGGPPIQSWSVSTLPVVDIGAIEGEPMYEFNRVVDVLRLPDGNFVVANGGSSELRFFSANGRFLRSAGRNGRGPGEFANISGVQLVDQDSLYVFDQGLRRVSVFSISGVFLSSFQLQATPDQVRPIRMYRLAGVLPSRDLVMVANRFPADMKAVPTFHFDSLPTLLYRKDGILIREIGEPAGMDMYATPRETGDVRFGRVSSAYYHAGLLYMTDGAQLGVRVYDPYRGIVRTIGADRSRRPVTRSDIDRMIEYWVGRAPEARKAEVRRAWEQWPKASHKPWISSLVVDDAGFVWAEQYEPFWSNAARTWHVFSPAGRPVAAVAMPQGLRVQQIGANFVLGVWSDEFDVEHIRMYSLRRR